MPHHPRNQTGVVLPTRVMVVSICLLALGGLFYLVSQPQKGPDTAARAASTPLRATPTAAAPTQVAVPPAAAVEKKPAVNRSAVHVEVYNNSNISGLAGRVATKAQGVGWNVVGSDNWYGTVETSTVYFSGKLGDAARMLARDLGIQTTKPAVAPMRLDRLTVILTGDYRG